MREVCHAIFLYLGPKYIKMPATDEDALKAVEEFEEKFGFPRCLGAVVGTHVNIKRPSNNPADYHNWKDSYFANYLDMRDHKYCFTYVVRWPESVRDAHIFVH